MRHWAPSGYEEHGICSSDGVSRLPWRRLAHSKQLYTQVGPRMPPGYEYHGVRLLRGSREIGQLDVNDVLVSNQQRATEVAVLPIATIVAGRSDERTIIVVVLSVAAVVAGRSDERTIIVVVRLRMTYTRSLNYSREMDQLRGGDVHISEPPRHPSGAVLRLRLLNAHVSRCIAIFVLLYLGWKKLKHTWTAPNSFCACTYRP